RRPGVNINDKHVEVVSRQMMRWVRIEDVGDTEFLIDEQTDKFRFGSGAEHCGERALRDSGGRPSGDGAAAAAGDHSARCADGIAL
ncbi:MAG TPA: hypothetical protein VL371_23340, partial [Gemmataceae bacterium]|nr:hypothetical protein [Gemmataceae bacterium]